MELESKKEIVKPETLTEPFNGSPNRNVKYYKNEKPYVKNSIKIKNKYFDRKLKKLLYQNV